MTKIAKSNPADACKQTRTIPSIIIADNLDSFFGGIQQRALDLQMAEAQAVQELRACV